MDKTINILEEFLKDYTMEGACGFWVQPDEDGGNPSVYIVIDLDWLQEFPTKPDFVARRMRQGLKEDIKNWTGIDVSYVGSTAKKCNESNNLLEQISPEIRRRLTFDSFKESLDNLLEYDIIPCSFDSVGEFVGDICDIMVDNVVDDIGVKLKPKEKDSLYHYFVDLFGKYLENIYHKECGKEYRNESIINWELWQKVKGAKNKIIVTESQYKRLFEEKKTKKEAFQELIDEKLQYIKDSCNKIESETFPNDVGFTSCDFVDMIESIKVDEMNMMTGARTDMYGNKYDSTPSIFIKLTINYQTIRNYHDFDEVIFDIKHMLRKSTGGLPIVLDYRTNNLKTTNEW